VIKNDLKNYLKAGYPALCVLTQESHRAEQLLVCDDWEFFVWDCNQGIRKRYKIIFPKSWEEIKSGKTEEE